MRTGVAVAVAAVAAWMNGALADGSEQGGALPDPEFDRPEAWAVASDTRPWPAPFERDARGGGGIAFRGGAEGERGRVEGAVGVPETGNVLRFELAVEGEGPWRMEVQVDGETVWRLAQEEPRGTEGWRAVELPMHAWAGRVARLAFVAETGPGSGVVRVDRLSWTGGADRESAGGPGVIGSAESEGLRQRVAREGEIPVLVWLNMPQWERETRLGQSAVTAQRASIQTKQRAVLGRLAGRGSATVRRTFTVAPGFAVRVDAAALEALERDSDVALVEYDTAFEPHLEQSVPLIGGTEVHAAGRAGERWAVVVMDTGVDAGHPLLAGKVVEEACFSEGNCPNGGDEQFGPGAAAPCRQLNCGHGTHVAGIAVGRTGVAPLSELIAIQVFSSTGGGSIGARRSDLIAGMEHVLTTLRFRHKIASVNLSLGSGKFLSPCPRDSLEPLIAQLRDAGIATAISSGNAGATNAIAAPACCPSALAVSATDKADQISSFANMGPQVALVAPGTLIRSAEPGGALALGSGTSMAAPHVAGAFALIRDHAAHASIDAILDELRARSPWIQDHRPGGSARAPRLALSEDLFQQWAPFAWADSTRPEPTLSVAGAGDRTLPDLSTNRFAATASAEGRVTSVRIRAIVEHSHISDLALTVIAPSGTSCRILLADTATNRLEADWDVSEPFRGVGVQGVWTLQIEDTEALDSGRLIAWALDFAVEPGPSAVGRATVRVGSSGPRVLADASGWTVGFEMAGMSEPMGVVRLRAAGEHGFAPDVLVRVTGPEGETAGLARRAFSPDFDWTEDVSAAFSGRGGSGMWTVQADDGWGRDSGLLTDWFVTWEGTDEGRLVRPLNDKWSRALAVSEGGRDAVVAARVAGATREMGERVAEGAAGQTVWWRWVAPESLWFRFELVDPNGPGVIQLFEGGPHGSLLAGVSNNPAALAIRRGTVVAIQGDLRAGAPFSDAVRWRMRDATPDVANVAITRPRNVRVRRRVGAFRFRGVAESRLPGRPLVGVSFAFSESPSSWQTLPFEPARFRAKGGRWTIRVPESAVGSSSTFYLHLRPFFADPGGFPFSATKTFRFTR